MPDSDTSGSTRSDNSEDGRTDVDVVVESHTATVILRRPPHNFLTEPALGRLADAIESLDGRVGAAVLCSEGRSFCAGADFRAPDAPDPTSDADGFRRQTAAFYAQAAKIFSSRVPLVAAIQGAAVGAGFGLALACDLRVLGPSAWFQANFVKLGIHPGFALTASLPMFVGHGRTAEIFLTGRRVKAREALEMGLAEKLVAQGEEVVAALDLAREIARGAPLAVSATRATIRAHLVDAAIAAMSHELARQTELAGTVDAVEGVRAMLERRDPRFEGC